MQLRASKRYNTSLCILLTDIDNFKSFNDEYGHQQGDTCLKAVASEIKPSIYRPADTAARYGGEEFVIILQNTDIKGGIEVSQNIQKNIAGIKELPINPITQRQISLSIGIACSHQTDNNNLVNLADKAIYKAKNNGRDQISYFSDDLQSVSFVVNKPVKNRKNTS